MTSAPARPRRRAKRGEGERLRAEILVAARELLAETQDADALTVRSVADRVGVSTPSIYLHFADKAALLDAVCEAVFADLDSLMEAAGAQSEDPFEGLRLRGVAYVRFALDNPEQYRLAMMTMPGRHDLGKTPLMYDDIVVGQTYGNLMGAVQRCIDVGVFAAGTDAQTVATTLWAAAHGAVSLCLAKPDLAGEDAEALCSLVIEHAGLGAALSSYVGGHAHGATEEEHEHSSAALAGMLRGLAAMSPPQA
ncbi:MAG TPA: TetR/AcrR family transcriptional regulator [Candidatus Nanopelagicales bacterium]|nr:TetR/AcrR family transcriptional regulator [Candidatus Nanopelagicales bacterium]